MFEINYINNKSINIKKTDNRIILLIARFYDKLTKKTNFGILKKIITVFETVCD